VIVSLYSLDDATFRATYYVDGVPASGRNACHRRRAENAQRSGRTSVPSRRHPALRPEGD
jgi:hypothetical protein